MIAKIIGLLFCFILQASCRDNLLIFGIAPDFIILGLVLVIKKNNISDGILFGAGCGFFYDLISYDTFGAGIFSLTLCGFIIAFLKKHVLSYNVFSDLIITLLVTSFNGLLSLILIYFFYFKINIPGEFLRISLPVSLYTSLLFFLVIIIYYLSKGNVKKVFG